LRIARELIRAKLSGQERVARNSLHNMTAAETINHFRSALDTTTTISAIRVLEAPRRVNLLALLARPSS
jgi:hypothetical protein